MASPAPARIIPTPLAAVPLTIAYDPALLESLRHAAQQAFDADAESVPVFGVLLGELQAGGPSLTAWHEATLLSAGLRPSLEKAAQAALAAHPDKAILGWFRAKYHGEARLSTEELETATSIFPGAVSLVLRPSSQRPLRVAAYRSLPDLPAVGERPWQEFFIHPVHAPAPNGTTPSASFVPPLRVKDLGWAVAGVLLLLVGFLGYSTWDLRRTLAGRVYTPVAVAPSQSLSVSRSGGQWVIQWAGDVRVDRAVLTLGRIVGSETVSENVELTPSAFAVGRYHLPIGLGDLDVLLRLERTGQNPSELRARVVGLDAVTPPTPQPAKPKLRRSRRQRQRAPA